MSGIDTWNHGFYLIIRERTGRGGKRLDVRVTDRSPALKAGEVQMYISLTVPRSLFQKPSLRGEINIPASAVRGPEITAEITTDLEARMKEATGYDITLKAQR